MSGTGPLSGPPAQPDPAGVVGVEGTADTAGRRDTSPAALAADEPGAATVDQPAAATVDHAAAMTGDQAAAMTADVGQAMEQPDAMAQQQPSGNAGSLLSGRYRLEQRIATGGMGEVWRATDEVLDRPVAVKLLRDAYVGDEALASRFRAEARYAASLSHPGIAQVFDYGEQRPGVGGNLGSGAYLVMELVAGEPLSAILARAGRLTASATLDIVAQAARALQAAHSSGIVHRDIKPGNLLVTADGRVKITDFGIARAAQVAQTGHLTQTGMVMGTAQYVSPEQASGTPVTHASDIYSLGVVAYECLAGRPPFAADALIAIAIAHVREAPPPLPTDVPPLVSDMVMRMLAKRPEDRPASARTVADRASVLRATLPTASAPALADVACDDPVAWYAEPSPTTPRTHDGSTTQLPIGDPQRLPPSWRSNAKRRVLMVAGMSAAVVLVGGLTTALMVKGHHATPTNGPARPSPTATAATTHSQSTAPAATPGSSAPASPPTSPAVPTSPNPSESGTPSPTSSASTSPTPTPTPTATPSSTQPPPTPPSSSPTASPAATSP